MIAVRLKAVRLKATMRRTLAILRPGLLALFLCAVACLPLSAGFAQESSGTDSSKPAAAEGQVQTEAHRSNAAEMSRESRESAGEGENAQFKHSATVRKIATMTGLSVDTVYWISVVLNFGVIAVVILWACVKQLPPAFRSRTGQIQKAMAEARKASEDANRRLSEIESRLSHLDGEIARMRATADKEAADEEARIQAAVEQEGRRIVESAEQEIAAATKSARRELAAHAASLAVSLAAQQIHVDRATDDSLLSDFMRELSSSGKDGA